MTTTVHFFGQLTDITGVDKLELTTIADTTELLKILQEKFPELDGAKFTMAVNNNIIQANTILNGNNTVALMPPFSGG